MKKSRVWVRRPVDGAGDGVGTGVGTGTGTGTGTSCGGGSSPAKAGETARASAARAMVINSRARRSIAGEPPGSRGWYDGDFRRAGESQDADALA